MCPHPLSLLFIVITRVPLILFTIMSSMNGLNTSRSIFILFVIILSIVLLSSSQSPLVLRAFSDANWVGDPTDHRSTTGYCFLLGSSLISWQSKKQTQVTCSNTKAEYRALTDTTSKFL